MRNIIRLLVVFQIKIKGIIEGKKTATSYSSSVVYDFPYYLVPWVAHSELIFRHLRAPLSMFSVIHWKAITTATFPSSSTPYVRLLCCVFRVTCTWWWSMWREGIWPRCSRTVAACLLKWPRSTSLRQCWLWSTSIVKASSTGTWSRTSECGDDNDYDGEKEFSVINTFEILCLFFWD